MHITADRLRELLAYTPETGVFTWRVQRSPQRPAGSVAGTVSKRGYRSINIDGHVYLAHRLAYLYMTGEWPHHQVDHERGNRDDNRWDKIRDVPRLVNNQNIVRPHADNKSGFLGVVKKTDTRFFAYIRDGKRNRYLGTYPTAEAAHEVYLAEKRRIHEGCTI